MLQHFGADRNNLCHSCASRFGKACFSEDREVIAQRGLGSQIAKA